MGDLGDTDNVAYLVWIFCVRDIRLYRVSQKTLLKKLCDF